MQPSGEKFYQSAISKKSPVKLGNLCFSIQEQLHFSILCFNKIPIGILKKQDVFFTISIRCLEVLIWDKIGTKDDAMWPNNKDLKKAKISLNDLFHKFLAYCTFQFITFK